MSRRLIALGGVLVLLLGLAAATRTLAAQEGSPQDPQAAPTAPLPYGWTRWNSLTDDQKAELQAARNEVLDARLRLLEKQAELGLIDPTAVEFHRERIAWMKQAPLGIGTGTAYGCPGYGPQGSRGFGVRGRAGHPTGRGPGMGTWGIMGPGW